MKCQHNLANWTATKFAISNSSIVFELISQHAMRIHPEFWVQLGRAVGLSQDQTVDRNVIARWVSLLIDTAPPTAYLNETWIVFEWLSQRCNERDLEEHLIEIFDALTPIRLEPTVLADHFRMNLFWENRLKPKTTDPCRTSTGGCSQKIKEGCTLGTQYLAAY